MDLQSALVMPGNDELVVDLNADKLLGQLINNDVESQTICKKH